MNFSYKYTRYAPERQSIVQFFIYTSYTYHKNTNHLPQWSSSLSLLLPSWLLLPRPTLKIAPPVSLYTSHNYTLHCWLGTSRQCLWSHSMLQQPTLCIRHDDSPPDLQISSKQNHSVYGYRFLDLSKYGASLEKPVCPTIDNFIWNEKPNILVKILPALHSIL